MSEMNFGAIDVGMTFVSVFVSIVFLFYLIKDKKSEKQYKRFDALVKFQDINKEYSCLLADVYCDIKDILADFINISEKVYDKIYHKIDIYKNKDKLNLRHNLNMRVVNFEMDVKNDVLMQSIEYLSKSKIATIYTTHDSDLSNKKYKDNQAEFHLSILYENFNMHYMSEYCDFVQNKLDKVKQFYKMQKIQIKQAIKKLEKEYLKFKFINKDINTSFHDKFSELLNLLYCLKSMQFPYLITRHKSCFLSHIVCNILQIRLVNVSINKMYYFDK